MCQIMVGEDRVANLPLNPTPFTLESKVSPRPTL